MYRNVLCLLPLTAALMPVATVSVDVNCILGIVSTCDGNRWCCCAGMRDAVDLLHPLLTDTVDYVKQGALIATALVLMQQPESKVQCNSVHCHVPFTLSASATCLEGKVL